jgi:hypothetical protein
MLEYVLEDELADVASEEAETYGLPWEILSRERFTLLAAALIRRN